MSPWCYTRMFTNGCARTDHQSARRLQRRLAFSVVWGLPTPPGWTPIFAWDASGGSCLIAFLAPIVSQADWNQSRAGQLRGWLAVGERRAMKTPTARRWSETCSRLGREFKGSSPFNLSGGWVRDVTGDNADELRAGAALPRYGLTARAFPIAARAW